jgi:Flp pilus assembly protein TadD/ADP-heptose:LPS heptosyltransferase
MTLDQLLAQARAHHTSMRLKEAEALYRQILAQQPDHPEATHLLGLIALQCGHPQPAIELMAKSVQLAPGMPWFHNNIAEAFKAAGRWDLAIGAYENFLKLIPNEPDAMHSLGVAQDRAGRTNEGVATLLRTMTLHPNFPKPYMSYGAILEKQARYDEALKHFEKACALKPDYAKARAGRAGAWLRAGDYARGWDEYEWRWRVEKFPGRRPAQGVPMWTGADLAGRRILLYHEQGLGDTIMFARYIPLVAARNGHVIVECPPELHALIREVDGVKEVVPPKASPSYDVQLPLLSLPRVFRTTIQTIPRDVPYLRVPADRAAKWAGKVPDDGRKKVGLCWTGGQTQPHRSIPTPVLAPLGRVPGVRFVSLTRQRLANEAPLPIEVLDLMADVNDFADTAAWIDQLDLVISIDTSVAHLAGALAKPTWVALARHADWRWLLGREDSPWYPTMRLFRQPEHGDWGSVIARIAQQLT